MQLYRQFHHLFIIIFFSSATFGQGRPDTYTKGEDLKKKTAKFLFIKVTVDKTTAFEGEAIKADYHLYVAIDLQGKMSKAPSYSGFASYDMARGNENEYRMETREGVIFKVYHIKSVQLFGLQPGINRIEPISFDATVRFRKNTPLDEKIISMSEKDTLINFEIKSKPVEINIKALPETTDKTFSGAVGNFEIIAALSTLSVAKNEPDTLRVALKGSGNWHDVLMPDIKFPNEIEVFQPSIQEAFDEKIVPLDGVKMYSFPFITTHRPKVVFPPVSFTFFNPATKKYKTVSSDSLYLTVRDEVYKPEQIETLKPPKNKDITEIFSKWALILFPLTAIFLAVLVWSHYKKRTGK